MVESLLEKEDSGTILTANLEAWTDHIGAHLTQELLGSVYPEIMKEKEALQKLEVQANAMSQQYAKLSMWTGIKKWLVWISVACNIGIAGYLIYLLVNGGAIVA